MRTRIGATIYMLECANKRLIIFHIIQNLFQLGDSPIGAAAFFIVFVQNLFDVLDSYIKSRFSFVCFALGNHNLTSRIYSHKKGSIQPRKQKLRYFDKSFGVKVVKILAHHLFAEQSFYRQGVQIDLLKIALLEATVYCARLVVNDGRFVAIDY